MQRKGECDTRRKGLGLGALSSSSVLIRDKRCSNCSDECTHDSTNHPQFGLGGTSQGSMSLRRAHQVRGRRTVSPGSPFFLLSLPLPPTLTPPRRVKDGLPSGETYRTTTLRYSDVDCPSPAGEIQVHHGLPLFLFLCNLNIIEKY